MKTLQNNHTTPEQSKRLLELGLPAWTADCYYYEEGDVCSDSTPQVVPFGEIWTDESTETLFSSYVDVPCWSVGRLMEIITICHLSRDGRFCFREDMCESLVETICGFVKYGEMDFSKLEE